MSSKNSITLYNNTHGRHVFSILSSSEIFDREEMTNAIEAIEGKTYTYEEIISIDIVNLKNITNINILPRNLQFLRIKTSTLEEINIPRNCTEIKTIILEETNLRVFPEIHFLTKLQTFTINTAFIDRIPDLFPPSLLELNLCKNSLSETHVDINKFPKKTPTRNTVIFLFNNCFREKVKLDDCNIVWGSQRERNVNVRITNYIIQLDEARDVIGNAIAYNPNIENIKETKMFESSQTVHISSICNSVTNSVNKIKELTKYMYNPDKKSELILELIYEFYEIKEDLDKKNNKKNNKINLTNIIKSFYESLFSSVLTSESTAKLKLKEEMISSIIRWVDCPDKHIKTDTKYGEMLARVWLLIKNHNQKEDFIANVKIELEASRDVCFTGRYNRLINSLVGFIDGVTVGISIKEQLQIEIGKIIAKLGKKELKYKECKKLIKELFDDPDVKEDETVTSYYMQSWLDALEEYKVPDDEDDEDEEEKKEEEDEDEEDEEEEEEDEEDEEEKDSL